MFLPMQARWPAPNCRGELVSECQRGEKKKIVRIRRGKSALRKLRGKEAWFLCDRREDNEQ